MPKYHHTSKQLEIEQIINRLGFMTDTEVGFGPYCADIFIPEINCICEIIGPQHYKKELNKRQNYITENYQITRFIYLPSNISKKEAKDVLQKHIDEYGKEDLRKLN